MIETFFILLSGGMLLAIVVDDAKPMRYLALTFASGGIAFYFLSDVPRPGNPVVLNVQRGLLAGVWLAAVLQAVLFRRLHRFVAFAGFVIAVLAGSHLLHDMMQARGTALLQPPKSFGMMLQTLSSAGIGTLGGLAVRSLILGEVGSRALFWFILIKRGLCAIVLVLILQGFRPLDSLWHGFAAIIACRWGMGLIIPGMLLYFAGGRGDARSRLVVRVASLFILMGEWLGLYLVRETSLPF